MSEIEEFEKFHPRAVKLLRKRKAFIVIADDEPYFMRAYGLIRQNEMAKGTWTPVDEACYIRAVEQRDEAERAGAGTDSKHFRGEGCEHDWIPAGEQVIEDAKFCPNCRTVRSKDDTDL